MVVGVNNIFGGLAAHEPGHRFPHLRRIAHARRQRIRLPGKRVGIPAFTRSDLTQRTRAQRKAEQRAAESGKAPFAGRAQALPRFRRALDHENIGPLQRFRAFAPCPGGDHAAPAVAQIVGPQEDDIEIAPHLHMLEPVVQHEQIRAQPFLCPAPRASAVRVHHHRSGRVLKRQHERFVPRLPRRP